MARLTEIVRQAAWGAAASALTAAMLVGAARAEWPERAITIIVPFPAGGASDLLGRLLAAELAPKLGQRIVVENRVGEVGNVGLSEAAQAAGNGYTLLESTNAMLINPIINPSLSKMAYDPLKDFAPIAYLGAAPNVIITRPSSGITSIAELIARAKANPGKLTYASPGIGSSSQLAMALLQLRAGIDMTHLAMNGSEPSLMAVISGATDVAAVGIGGLISHIRSGEIKALAQTGGERWVDLPDVPTLVEAGIPNAVVETSEMFLAPVQTPERIIGILSQATKSALARPDIKAAMIEAGFLVQYEGPDALRERMAREIPAWRDIIVRAGLLKK